MHRLRPVSFAPERRCRLIDGVFSLASGRQAQQQAVLSTSVLANASFGTRYGLKRVTPTACLCTEASSPGPAEADTKQAAVEGENKVRQPSSEPESTIKREYAEWTKRQYKSAPKRNHGFNAGWRKFSQHVKERPWHTPRAKNAEKKELHEVKSTLKEIRVSPWQLNLLAKLVRNLPVQEAIAQLQFNKKKHTVTFQRIIQNACNLAEMRHGLLPAQLRCAEVVVTKGKSETNITIMGRGRVGVGKKKWSHLNMTLREIDFDDEINNAPNKRQLAKLTERKKAVEQLVWKSRGMSEDSMPVEAEFASAKET